MKIYVSKRKKKSGIEQHGNTKEPTQPTMSKEENIRPNLFYSCLRIFSGRRVGALRSCETLRPRRSESVVALLVGDACINAYTSENGSG